MNNLLLWLGRSAGAAGLILCLLSGGARLAGQHWFGSFEALTLLQAGIGGMVLGCLCLLLVLTNNATKN